MSQRGFAFVCALLAAFALGCATHDDDGRYDYEDRYRSDPYDGRLVPYPVPYGYPGYGSGLERHQEREQRALDKEQQGEDRALKHEQRDERQELKQTDQWGKDDRQRQRDQKKQLERQQQDERQDLKREQKQERQDYWD